METLEATTTFINLTPVTTSDIIQIVYVIATLGLLCFAYKQISTATRGLELARDQFNEQNRANVIAEIRYIRNSAALLVKNIGQTTAEHVKISIPDDFLATLSSLDNKFSSFDLGEARRKFIDTEKTIAAGASYATLLWSRTQYANVIAKHKELRIDVSFFSNTISLTKSFTYPIDDEFLIAYMPEERIATTLESIEKLLEKK